MTAWRPAPTNSFSRSSSALNAPSKRDRDEGLGLPLVAP